MKEKTTLNPLLLNIGKATHNGDWNWKNVSSPFSRLYLVTEGFAEVEIENRRLPLHPGHLYLIPPFASHNYICEGRFVLYYIHIYEEVSTEASFFDLLAFPFEIAASKLDYSLIERLVEINPNRELPASNPASYNSDATLLKSIAESTAASLTHFVETRGILLQLFSRFIEGASEIESSKDNRIAKALRFIREHIDDKLSTQQIASFCLLSTDHFIRLFRKEVGITPIEYINRRKINRTQLLLLINNDSIKEVAYSVGFVNISYFNRLFKQYTGMSPAAYRNKLTNQSK